MKAQPYQNRSRSQIPFRGSVFLLIGLLLFTNCKKEKEPSAPEAPVNTSSVVTIGTGEPSSLAHLTGQSIAQTAEKALKDIYVLAVVKPTDGSVSNLKAILSRELEFALVSSYDLYQAVKGRGEWEAAGQQKDVLAVFTLYVDALTLLGAEDTGIKSLADLKGKRVNIGLPDSKEQQAVTRALADSGIDVETFFESIKIDTESGLNMLQEGRLDAAFYMTVHPNDRLKTAAMGKKKLRVLSIPVSRKFFFRYPYYIRTSIPAELYPGATGKNAVETFGIKTTLVAATRVPKEIVYAVIEGVFDNNEGFQKMHPAYQGLTKKNMTDGMYRMIHRGALYYYMQNGYRLSCCF